jgi:hypothetical protein
VPQLGHAELEDGVGGQPAGPLVVGAEGPAEGEQGFAARLLDHLAAGEPEPPAVLRAGDADLLLEGLGVGVEPVGDGLPGRPAGAEFGGAVEQVGLVGGVVCG